MSCYEKMEWMRGLLMAVVSILLTVPKGVYSGPEDCCSAGDTRLIQASWYNVWGGMGSARRIAIARAIFDDFFVMYPDAKKLLKRVKVDEPESGEFQSHLVRVANGIDLMVHLLDTPYVLSEQLAHLGEAHEARPGVKQVYFQEFVRSVARVLPKVDSCFNVHAWNRCFEKLMIVVSAYLP